MQKLLSVCALVFLVAILPVRSQPVINEFMASNLSTYPDNCDFDDYSDWIELHNPAGSSVALTNYYLTDNLAEPFKWLIPTNATIAANGYLMFRADGFDAAPGETHLRGYWPWGTTFVTRRYHTGFKLSATGEALGLYRTDLPPQDVTMVTTNAVWNYLVTATAATNWMAPAYVDSGWAQGAAQLGYGDGDEGAVIGYGPSSTSKYPTTYFRKHFAVSDPARLGNIRLRVIVDDGAVLYLNGTEFARVRMNSGVIAYGDYANANPPAENAWETIELPRALFVAGDNVLAAEVHQVTAGSSDLSWAAELVVAEITGPAILVDSVTFGPQTTDVSY
ncbi:MAG TPA: lamin tail domain-containing protein, partial [Candidatus Paceibacterota bacterium]|nr:lamin tail domain-containing protein [Candidatus Paceibacterota bacterium]